MLVANDLEISYRSYPNDGARNISPDTPYSPKKQFRYGWFPDRCREH